VRLYRLTSPEYDTVDEAFSGEGAEQYGGRWNRPGTPAVYLSENVSLTAIERLIRLKDEYADREYNLFTVEWTDPSVCKKTVDGLPDEWNARPPRPPTQMIGDEFLEGDSEGDSHDLLSVPSVVVPPERNYVARPKFTEAPDVTISGPEPFAFDDGLTERIVETG
jgi:RES domain-containing protein